MSKVEEATPIIRAATDADWPAIHALIRAAEPVDRAGLVNVDGSVRWQPLASWEIVVAEDHGVPVGYAGILWPTQDNCHAMTLRIHPAYRGQGFGTRLGHYLVERAQQRGIGLMGEYQSYQPLASSFIRRFGGQEIGRWHEMVADPLPQHVSAPALPEGYRLRHAVAGRDEAAFADVFGDTFREHRFLSPPSVEDVRERWGSPLFDGDRVALAEYAGDVVGVSVIRPVAIYRGDQLVSAGVIGPVGVRTAHRQRGLARALVLDNLRYGRQAGWETASLSVDEINHNAQALYRSLGFVKQYEWVWWQIKHEA